MPDPLPPRVDGVTKAGIAGSALAALALAVTSIASWEGKRNAPYRDPIGILTVCYGETAAEMRRYTDAECRAMLEQRTAGFMEGVRARNPAIAGYPRQWAAHTSFAYNVGLAAYGRSSVARLFAQGRQVDACRFMGRYVYSGGRRLQGLANRRAAEIALCLQDAQPARPIAALLEGREPTAAAGEGGSYNTQWTSVDPPLRFRADRHQPFAAVFLSEVGQVCRLRPPEGQQLLACVQRFEDGSQRMVLPNPCAFAATETFGQYPLDIRRTDR